MLLRLTPWNPSQPTMKRQSMLLSETPPVSHEILYANHRRGFALCSMRNENLSRYYIQAPVDDPLEKWTDDAFWDELRRRIPEETASRDGVRAECHACNLHQGGASVSFCWLLSVEILSHRQR